MLGSAGWGHLVAAICCLGDEQALQTPMLAQLCVQRLLILPLLCQVANEQGDLRSHTARLLACLRRYAPETNVTKCRDKA